MAKIRIIFGLMMLAFLSSCSVFMAANQPDKKDLGILRQGAHQSVVRSELGAPIWSGKEGDCNVEIYKFTQGYSKGAKTGRAVFHGIADVMTLGLWEVVGTPTESIADGQKMTVKICYDENLYAKNVIATQENGEAVPIGESATASASKPVDPSSSAPVSK